jgi:Domain of unknown function (DUF4157)
MASVKLSPRTGNRCVSRSTSDTPQTAPACCLPGAPSGSFEGVDGAPEPGSEGGCAAHAAAVSRAQATIGTARLNRLLNPLVGRDRAPPSAQSSETLPIGAVEAGRAPRGGRPLETNVRQIAERAVGADLSAVRVHTDEHANAAAESLSARAFTSGKDVFLGPGESPTDSELIAHEVAQVQHSDSNSKNQP